MAEGIFENILQAEEFKSVPSRLRNGQILIDLVGITEQKALEGQYDGICW